jgi:hypothetical protein
MMSETAGTKIGSVNVVATQGRGLNPEEFADLTVDKIMKISDGAHPVIKQQAEVFKERLRALLVRQFAMAQRSERTTLYNMFMNQGHEDMAEIIKRL